MLAVSMPILISLQFLTNMYDEVLTMDAHRVLNI